MFSDRSCISLIVYLYFFLTSVYWQAELKSFDDAATTIGLHTSWEKTKLQNIGFGPPSQSVSVDGHPVEVTDKFVYLGSTVDSTGYSNPDILRRIGLASIISDGPVGPSLAPESAESCY